MTKEELEDVLHVLGLDYEPEANQIYVFYVLPDGRVDNFSLSVRCGAGMNDNEILTLMRREYPATRQGRVVAMERPDGTRHFEQVRRDWVDVNTVCQMLGVSRKTLRKWTTRGLFHASHVGDRIYYERDEVDRVMRANLVQENGRIDNVGAKALMGNDGE